MIDNIETVADTLPDGLHNLSEVVVIKSGDEGALVNPDILQELLADENSTYSSEINHK